MPSTVDSRTKLRDTAGSRPFPLTPSVAPKAPRRRAEELLDKPAAEIARMSQKGVEHLMRELRAHQIELEIQNDELRRTQIELEQARDRYSDLYDLAPAAYLTLSAGGEILEANLSAGQLLGLGRSRLLHQELSRFLPTEAQAAFDLFCRQVLRSGIQQSVELDLVNAKSRRLVVQLEAGAIRRAPVSKCA